jgi:hypothetical protein
MNEKKNRIFLAYTPDANSEAEGLKQRLTAAGLEIVTFACMDNEEANFERDALIQRLDDCQAFVALLTPESCGDIVASNQVQQVFREATVHALRRVPALPLVAATIAEVGPPDWFQCDTRIALLWPGQSEESVEKAFQSLKLAIENAIQKYVRDVEPFLYRLRDLQLTPVDFTPFVDDRLKDVNLSRREWLCSEVRDLLNSTAARGVLLIGDPGIGKTTLICQLVRDPEFSKDVLAEFFCNRDHSLAASDFVETLIVQAADRIPELRDALDSEDAIEALQPGNVSRSPYTALMVGLIEPLCRLKNHPPRMYLVVDGLNESVQYPLRPSIVEALADVVESLPHWLRLLFSSRTLETDGLQFSGLQSYAINPLDPRNLRDVEDFLSKQVPQGLRNIDTNFAEGNFLVASIALQTKFWERPNHTIGSGLDAWFGKILEPVLTEIGILDAGFRPILEILVAAREPVSIDQITEWLNSDSRQDLELQLKILRPILHRTNGRYSIYHNALREWLTEVRDGKTIFIDLHSAETRFADFCWEEYNRGGRRPSEYVARNAVCHLRQARMHKEAIQTWSWLDSCGLQDEKLVAGIMMLGRQLAECSETFTDLTGVIPESLARLLTAFYEVEPLRIALEKLPQNSKKAVLKSLLTESDNVTRFCAGRARESTPIAPSTFLSVPTDDAELSEWEAEAWETTFSWIRGVKAQDGSVMVPECDVARMEALQVLSESRMWTGPRVVGEAMVHCLLNFPDRASDPDIREIARRVAASPWAYVRVLAKDLTALAENLELPKVSLRDGESLEERLARLMGAEPPEAVAKVVASYNRLRLDPGLVRKAFSALAPSREIDPMVLEFGELLLQHPMWEIAEAAASSIRNLYRGKSELIATLVHQGLETKESWRLRYGVVELAFSFRLEAPDLWDLAVRKTYHDENARVRSLCVENTINAILACRGALRMKRLRNAEQFLDFWLEQSDQQCAFVLEGLWRLYSELHRSRIDVTKYLPTKVSPLLQQIPGWYKLNRATFLQRLEHLVSRSI